MAISNANGWIVLTTGNKSEMAVGYATLYGDMAGGYALLKDVPKTLVYELCEHRNEVAGTDLVPRAVLDKPPSAELRPDQRDDQSLPPYEVLDPILEGYVEQDLTVEDLEARGFDGATVRRVIDLVDHAEYKRRQAPPGPRVTCRGFGKDRRMPITNRVPGLGRPSRHRRGPEDDPSGDRGQPRRPRRARACRCSHASARQRRPSRTLPSPAGAPAASLAHAWRAAQVDELLPVSVGLPGEDELAVVPGGGLGDELAAVGAAADAAARAPADGAARGADSGSDAARGLVEVVAWRCYPALERSYSQVVDAADPAAAAPVRLVVGRVVADLGLAASAAARLLERPPG